jgi:hypothetical protein
MVRFDDMTPDERDRFIYLILSEKDLNAIVHIMHRKYGSTLTNDQIMRFAFKVALNKFTPAHLKKENKKGRDQ